MPITRHPLAGDPRQLRNVPIDLTTIGRLEESLRSMLPPRVKADADLPSMFYQLLFERYPLLRAMFPTDMTAQKKKLLDALVMVIENLRTPSKVRASLQELGRRHVGYGTKAEHYPLVCACLLDAMKKVAGDTWSGDQREEWRIALELVSEAMLSGTGEG